MIDATDILAVTKSVTKKWEPNQLPVIDWLIDHQSTNQQGIDWPIDIYSVKPAAEPHPPNLQGQHIHRVTKFGSKHK
jgi:hypothetical protein